MHFHFDRQIVLEFGSATSFHRDKSIVINKTRDWKLLKYSSHRVLDVNYIAHRSCRCQLRHIIARIE